MKCQKKLFSLSKGVHYLNCAYKAPRLRAAEKAAKKALKKSRNPMNIRVDDFFDESQKIRVEFAKLINGKAENIAIIPSTSYGFSSALNNIEAKKGGHALTLEDEFPSGYFSLQRWCYENQNELKIVRPKGLNQIAKDWSMRIAKAINEKTSVVLISSIHWMSGVKFDLDKIGKQCKKYNTILIVDGTQSVGALPIDVLENNIDVLVCGTYKWMFGPYSMALAYLNDKFDKGKPLEESWMNRTNAKMFSKLTNYEVKYKKGAGRYNVGQTTNFILSPMLLLALKQINEWGVENIQAYCSELTRPLKKYLKKINLNTLDGDNYSDHLFPLQIDNSISAKKLKKQLLKNKVVVSVRGNNLRISVNVFNNKKDIKKLIKSIKKSRILK